MRTINSLLKAVEKIQIQLVCEIAVDQTKENLLSLNRQQMFDGKTETGGDISPSYLEDPYFKSRESAQRYSDWKDKITPNPKRKKGVPNLFIVGTFHDSISIEVAGSSIKFQSSFEKASAIVSKFSGNIYGLGGEYKADYIVTDLSPATGVELVKQLNKK